MLVINTQLSVVHFIVCDNYTYRIH